MLNACLHSKLEHDDRYIASINYICKAISNTGDTNEIDWNWNLHKYGAVWYSIAWISMYR